MCNNGPNVLQGLHPKDFVQKAWVKVVTVLLLP